MNRRAYMKLCLWLKEDDKVSFQLVKNATTTDFPQGSAKLAWEALAERFEPRKEVNKQILTTELFSLKMEDSSKDPEKWILELQQIQSRLKNMNSILSDELLMNHILGNLPKEYEHVADMLARDATKTIV